MDGILNHLTNVAKIRLWILCVIILSSLNTLSWAIDGVWEPLGPEGGNFSAAVVNPIDESQVTAFTIDPSCVYRTSDGGNHWIKVGKVEEIDDQSIDGFYVFDYSTIYALSLSTLYYSHDGGTTWQNYSFPYEEGYPTQICVHPIDPNRLYAIGYYYAFDDLSNYSCRMAFFQSTNGGKTWNAKQYFSYDSFYPEDMAVSVKNPDVILVTGSISRGENYGTLLAKSTDGGETWNDISSTIKSREGDFINCVAIDPSDENHLFAANSSIYSSKDGGKTWKPASGVYRVNQFFFNPVQPMKVFVGVERNVYYSADDIHWDSCDSSNIIGVCNSFAFNPSNPSVIYLCTSLALYKSTDGGTTWTKAHNGIYNSTISSFAIAPSDPKTIYADYKGKNVLLSRDGGQSWNETYPFLACGNINALAVHPTNPNQVLALEGFG